MKQNTIISVIVIGLIIVIALVLGSNKKPNTSDKVIRIGAPLSLSGVASQDGENIKNGMELAKQELAAKGTTVEILYQDDKTDTKETVSAINYLISQKVDGVVGPTWSFLVEAGLPILEAHGITAVLPATTSEVVTTGKENSFELAPKNAFKEVQITKYLQDNPDKKRIAVIVDNTSWGQSNLVAIKAAAEKTSREIVIEEKFAWGSEADSMRTLGTKVNAMNPDVVMTSMDSEEGIVIMVQNLSRYSQDFDILAGSTTFIRMFNEKKITVPADSRLYVLEPKNSPRFIENYKKMYGRAPGAYADTGYDGLMLLVNAIQNKKDSETTSQYIKRTSYQGILKTYEFDEKNDVKEGEWVLNKIN